MLAFRVFAVLAAIGVSSVTPAFARTVQCVMDVTPNRYYIAPEIQAKIGEFGQVAVTDAIILSTDRKQVIGTLPKDDAQRLSILWEVKGVTPDPTEYRAYGSHLVVRLTIQKADGSARMTISDAQARKYQYRTKGTCRIKA